MGISSFCDKQTVVNYGSIIASRSGMLSFTARELHVIVCKVVYPGGILCHREAGNLPFIKGPVYEKEKTDSQVVFTEKDAGYASRAGTKCNPWWNDRRYYLLRLHTPN